MCSGDSECLRRVWSSNTVILCWCVACAVVMMGGQTELGDWTYLVQSLPEGEDWGEFSGPGLSIKLPLHVSNPGDYLQLGDDSRAYCTLARALDVSRETKEGGLVCLWKGTDDRFVVLYVMFCACTCVSCVRVLCTQLFTQAPKTYIHT